MLIIQSNKDLEQFGIVLLTGEACAYSRRILCDMTITGYKIFCKCYGFKPVPSTENNMINPAWNKDSYQSVLSAYNGPRVGEPHLYSVMLPYDAWHTLGFWCLEQLKGIRYFAEVNRDRMLSNVRYFTYHMDDRHDLQITKEKMQRYEHIINYALPENAYIAIGSEDIDGYKEEDFQTDFHQCIQRCAKVYTVKNSSRNVHQMSGRLE